MKLSVVFLFLMILVIGLVITFYATKPSFSKNDFRNEEPEKVVELYWDASFRGDGEMVKELSGLLPPDFFQDCKGIKAKESDEGKIQIDPNSILEKLEPEYISPGLPRSKTSIQDRFDSPLVNPIVSSKSATIYLSKIPVSLIRIKNKKTFDDEAIIYIESADYKGSFEKAILEMFFLKRGEYGWKIISITGNETGSWDNTDYATKKPKCSEK